MDVTSEFVSAVIVAMARTWDSKLPGYRAEMTQQLSILYVETPVAKIELRTQLDALLRGLEDPYKRGCTVKS